VHVAKNDATTTDNTCKMALCSRSLFTFQVNIYVVAIEGRMDNQGNDLLLGKVGLGRNKINSHLLREQCIFLLEIYIKDHECGRCVVLSIVIAK
jgi:hypothetical protein